jgi:hypothetical protein
MSDTHIANVDQFDTIARVDVLSDFPEELLLLNNNSNAYIVAVHMPADIEATALATFTYDHTMQSLRTAYTNALNALHAHALQRIDVDMEQDTAVEFEGMSEFECPGCGCRPGDGCTPGCTHRDGCGAFTPFRS